VADRADRDEGVSTVFGALMVGLLIVVTGVCVRLGGAVLARQQAETAADLGALAGAAQVLRGADAACAAAGRVVAANRARLVSCVLDRLDVLVQVEVAAAAFGGSASARARAGPVTTP
jgi:secretion/DNA translocation related TadE-like protein